MTGRIVTCWLVLAAALCLVALPRLGTPGLYYDEAFLASQAKDFVEPQLRARHPPGTRAVWLAGRPWPLMNVAYLGALKSQLLVPSLALFGATLPVLRATTLAVGLVALLLAMLWAGRVFGLPVALVGGALVASDPTYQFLGVYEWGPFTTGLLCRSAGLLLVTLGWSRRRPGWLWLGAFVLGLGVYSRADFVLFLAAAGLALLVARPGTLREALDRRGHAIGAALALALGAAPVVISLDAVFAAAGVLPPRGGLERKLAVGHAMLDGSYFYRLMAAGGRFELLSRVRGAPAGLLGWLVLGSGAGLVLAGLRRRARGAAPRPEVVFLLVLTVLLGAGILALPGATRIHHLAGLVPFHHLIVACAAVAAWRAAGSRRRALRGAIVLALAAGIAANAAVTLRTYRLIEASGGRGWWSDALVALARDLRDDPGVVVSLDWGFHEPLLFLTRSPRLLEPIWEIRRSGSWSFEGDPRTLYLVHDEELDRFGIGPALLRAARALPPGEVEVETHRDREGGVAFLALRFARPHRLRYTGSFEIRWTRPGSATRPPAEARE